MRTRIQLLLDKSVGSVLNILLYGMVRILGFLLRINHQLDRPFNRIVVCKFKGMGSIVQASALLKTLRINYPQAEICFVSTKANSGILHFYKSCIDREILVDDKSFSNVLISTFKAIISLWKFRPQVYIDLEIYSNYSTLLCTLSAATNRLGYYKSDKDYRAGLFTHLMYYNIKAPLSEIYLQMARILPLKEVDSNLIPPPISDNYKTDFLQKIKSIQSNFNGQYLVVNPNASDLRLERRWPSASFIQLIKEFRNKHPEIQLVLIGNKQEANYVNQISSEFSQDLGVINSSGKLNLNELMALIDSALGVVTNDTGPLHMALSLKKPTVGLFGPCAPHQYGQMETCIPIYMNVYCSPCVHEFMTPPCAGDNQCMKQIGVAQVIQAIDKLLNQTKIKQIENPIGFQTNGSVLGFVYNR